MAPPRAGGPRRSQQPSEHIYTLGERGRKTGVTLRDTGVRDEHGMEPIDDIFSSPAKSRDGDASEDDEEDNEEAAEEEDEDDDDDGDYGEADMELTTGGPDPATLLNGQRSAARRLAQAQSQQQQRSPAKASLFGSPAVRRSGGSRSSGSGGALRNSAAIRQNPLLRPPTSPPTAHAAGRDNLSSSPSKPVKRRLDFGKTGSSANAQRRPYTLAPPTNGAAAAAKQQLLRDEEDEDEEEDEESILHGSHNVGDESMQMVGAYGDDEPPEPEPEQEYDDEAEEPEPIPQPKRRGRPPAKVKSTASEPPARTTTAAQASASTASKRGKRGRPRKSGDSDTIPEQDEAEEHDDDDEERQKAKRPRVEAHPDAPPKKRGRPSLDRAKVAQAAASQRPEEADDEAPAVPKKRGRKRKSSGVGNATAAAAAVPRGPPLPKSRGLVIRRRDDGDGDAAGIVKTRSGRNAFRPLAFWRGEHLEYDQTDVWGDGLSRRELLNGGGGGGRHILLPSVREIHRVDDEDLPPLASKAGRHAGGGADGPGRPRKSGSRRGRRRRDGEDDDDEDDEGPDREPWETDPGRITGEVIVWYPEHELDPPGPGQEVEMAASEIALSSAAMQAHEVRGATFRFVKTLSLPFFGTGMVDLPPGAEKRPKNSRKMHMTFFVHYGQVSVTVNETSFRIAKGGMWSVPRGNYYSILNDTDHPARIFFSQGCEVLTTVEPEDEGGD